MGNLRVKISQLLGFFLLTLLIEMPLVVLLVSIPGLELYPFEYALDGTIILFLIVELVASFFASRKAISCVTKEFQATKVLKRQDAGEFENPAFNPDDEKY